MCATGPFRLPDPSLLMELLIQYHHAASSAHHYLQPQSHVEFQPAEQENIFLLNIPPVVKLYY